MRVAILALLVGCAGGKPSAPPPVEDPHVYATFDLDTGGDQMALWPHGSKLTVLVERGAERHGAYVGIDCRAFDDVEQVSPADLMWKKCDHHVIAAQRVPHGVAIVEHAWLFGGDRVLMTIPTD